jgi:hypothetical protein
MVRPVVSRLPMSGREPTASSRGRSLSRERRFCSRWLGLTPESGQFFALAPATISVLGFEREQHVIIRWNDRCHLILPSYVWAERGDLDVRPGDPSVGSGDDRPMHAPGTARGT